VEKGNDKQEHNKEMMSTTSQTSVNHSLFEEQDQIPTQMGFNIPFPSTQAFAPLGCHQSLKSISAMVPSLSSEPASSAANFAETLFSTAVQRPRQDLTSSLVGGGGGQLLSLNRSRLNPW